MIPIHTSLFVSGNNVFTVCACFSIPDIRGTNERYKQNEVFYLKPRPWVYMSPKTILVIKLPSLNDLSSEKLLLPELM